MLSGVGVACIANNSHTSSALNVHTSSALSLPQIRLCALEPNFTTVIYAEVGRKAS